MRTKATRSVANRGSGATGTVRIIGGVWRRRTLGVVDIPGLRPTPDRVRETLFNWLTHAFGGDLAGLTVLDLFAGTGALGFEAASRGAASVTLVENNQLALEELRQARTLLGAVQIDIIHGDAAGLAATMQRAGHHFDLVLLDPPFGHGWLDTALPLAAALCKPLGLIYVEAEAPLPESLLEPLDLAFYRTDKAGEVFYHLLRRNIKK